MATKGYKDSGGVTRATQNGIATRQRSGGGRNNNIVPRYNGNRAGMTAYFHRGRTNWR